MTHYIGAWLFEKHAHWVKERGEAVRLHSIQVEL